MQNTAEQFAWLWAIRKYIICLQNEYEN